MLKGAAGKNAFCRCHCQLPANEVKIHIWAAGVIQHGGMWEDCQSQPVFGRGMLLGYDSNPIDLYLQQCKEHCMS